MADWQVPSTLNLHEEICNEKKQTDKLHADEDERMKKVFANDLGRVTTGCDYSLSPGKISPKSPKSQLPFGDLLLSKEECSGRNAKAFDNVSKTTKLFSPGGGSSRGMMKTSGAATATALLEKAVKSQTELQEEVQTSTTRNALFKPTERNFQQFCSSFASFSSCSQLSGAGAAKMTGISATSESLHEDSCDKKMSRSNTNLLLPKPSETVVKQNQASSTATDSLLVKPCSSSSSTSTATARSSVLSSNNLFSSSLTRFSVSPQKTSYVKPSIDAKIISECNEEINEVDHEEGVLPVGQDEKPLAQHPRSTPTNILEDSIAVKELHRSLLAVGASCISSGCASSYTSDYSEQMKHLDSGSGSARGPESPAVRHLCKIVEEETLKSLRNASNSPKLKSREEQDKSVLGGNFADNVPPTPFSTPMKPKLTVSSVEQGGYNFGPLASATRSSKIEEHVSLEMWKRTMLLTGGPSGNSTSTANNYSLTSQRSMGAGTGPLFTATANDVKNAKKRFVENKPSSPATLSYKVTTATGTALEQEKFLREIKQEIAAVDIVLEKQRPDLLQDGHLQLFGGSRTTDAAARAQSVGNSLKTGALMIEFEKNNAFNLQTGTKSKTSPVLVHQLNNPYCTYTRKNDLDHALAVAAASREEHQAKHGLVDAHRVVFKNDKETSKLRPSKPHEQDQKVAASALTWDVSSPVSSVQERRLLNLSHVYESPMVRPAACRRDYKRSSSGSPLRTDVSAGGVSSKTSSPDGISKQRGRLNGGNLQKSRENNKQTEEKPAAGDNSLADQLVSECRKKYLMNMS
ncbi:unnamed protein product [Amoebophrya sp. A120]|nr:unnamed protein product [Amoebophrya sp. A120]|eukprot:GSA120T00016935001.1